jgi:hypothetical protein
MCQKDFAGRTQVNKSTMTPFQSNLPIKDNIIKLITKLIRTAASCTYDSFFSFVDSGFTNPSKPDFTAACITVGISKSA